MLSGYGECEFEEVSEYVMCTLEGAAAEVKLSWSSSYTSRTSLVDTHEMAQLIASMEKLARDMAHSVTTGADAMLFHVIIIYGLLMNFGTKQSILVKLQIDFIKGVSTFFIAKDAIDIHDSVERLHYCLNSDTD